MAWRHGGMVWQRAAAAKSAIYKIDKISTK
jgi:hypothetical protein